MDIHKLSTEAMDFLDNGDIESAEKILIKLKMLEETPELKYTIGALLVEIGESSKNIEYIVEGIKNFEEIKNIFECDIDYNLANSYMAKYKVLNNKPNYLTTDDHLLFKAKKSYVKGITKTQPSLIPSLFVNLGNTYNYIGRTIEALEYYEIVLNNSIHPLALLNKGIGLCVYSNFIKDSRPIIKDAYECFHLILENPSVSQHLKDYSKKYIDYIEKCYNKEFLDNELKKELKRPINDNFEGFMINFCLENKLYLNLCNFCQRCENSIGDTIILDNMIVESKYELEEDPFLILSSYLNQIKMDFVSARFLLILSQYDNMDLDFITKNVYITNTLTYEENDIRIQLLKNSFTSFFNILDKIAYFINDYLEIGKPSIKADFRHIWFNSKGNKINKKIECINNPGLNALYDIYLDLEHGNEKAYLRKIRNDLTHKFLRISFIEINEDDKNIEEFTKDNIELAKIVKNAIIYLIRLVKVHEDFKYRNLEENNIPQLYADVIKL